MTFTPKTTSDNLSASSPAYYVVEQRKYHRHHCPHRRCLPLHSRVPFP
uniref:Uncharacterized protein n=1 Tax=Lates calcarifer TaxID=8187 RepID=A0A4W6EJG1_LATCA